ncbi:hypothetical protein BSL82_15660 [Tardibacter chloracetimidivorans]|uniref:Uncharacterized protein n=1 Tax=Tardibacter chloracetimidivorans TaxID=1921510 RepID=A0A1L3ZY33_9SPHN|nr:hypothetical protein [Tardibacter chloracetimidivorans]API60541.1 hypothetical protein BSL82_15660 [Tardibacter chloracetimidivorans]
MRDTDHFPPEPPKGGRTLSDQDVQAIVFQLRQQLTDEFYNDLGRGLWAWIKKIAIGAILALAAYGAAKGMKF